MAARPTAALAPAQAAHSKKQAPTRNHFISKNDLLAWINDLLKVDLTLVEQLGSGTMYCQIFDVIHPGTMQLAKVKWSAKLEYDFLHNFKILQSGFDKLQIAKSIPVHKLAKARYQDNLEFAQWVKGYFDFNCKDKGKGYEALKRRGSNAPYFGFCKGGVLPSKTLFYRNPNEKFSHDDFSNSSISEHDGLDDDSLSLPLRPNITTSGPSSRSASVSKISPNFATFLSPIKHIPDLDCCIPSQSENTEHLMMLEDEQVPVVKLAAAAATTTGITATPTLPVGPSQLSWNEELAAKRERIYESLKQNSANKPTPLLQSGELKERMVTESGRNNHSNNKSSANDNTFKEAEKQQRTQEFLNRFNAKKLGLAQPSSAQLATITTAAVHPIASTLASSIVTVPASQTISSSYEPSIPKVTPKLTSTTLASAPLASITPSPGSSSPITRTPTTVLLQPQVASNATIPTTQQISSPTIPTTTTSTTTITRTTPPVSSVDHTNKIGTEEKKQLRNPLTNSTVAGTTMSTYATMTSNLISKLQEITNGSQFLLSNKKEIENSQAKAAKSIPIDSTTTSNPAVPTTQPSLLPLPALSRTLSAPQPCGNQTSLTTKSSSSPQQPPPTPASTTTPKMESRKESNRLSEFETPLIKRLKSNNFEQSSGGGSSTVNCRIQTKKRIHSNEVIVGTIKDIIARGQADYDSIVDRIRLYMFSQQTYDD